ncbi:MAG: hypothetical protein QM668_10170 [Agriterribacter sp.]
MMKALLTTGWSFMRILRTGMGIAALIFAIKDHDFMLGIAGGLLLIMGVMNTGCCGVNGCSVNARPAKKSTTKNTREEIAFEEVA